MKSNEASIFLFFASIIVGLLLSLNMGIGKKNSTIFLNAKQYHDAYNTKNRLINEIKDLNEQYEVSYNKLQTYKESEQNSVEIFTEINNELKTNKIELGEVAVKGEGIRLTLYDGDFTFDTEYVDAFDVNRRIIHDADILNIINDLKNGGAEVIAINGQRIIGKSDMWCGGAYINVDGIHQPSPYIITAIGNKESLKNYMLDELNYLKYLMSDLRGIRATVEQGDELKISPYIGEISSKYSKSKN